jgi:SLIT-ROBO Rho GTPase activating protein
MYTAEAIALYDYKGRSDKEISFRKGDKLAILGQLSTDWWQGYAIQCGNQSSSRIGYIPDKYIALKSKR